MIGVYNHLLSKVFRFHYHSQKVIGSLGHIVIIGIFVNQILTPVNMFSFHASTGCKLFSRCSRIGIPRILRPLISSALFSHRVVQSFIITWILWISSYVEDTKTLQKQKALQLLKTRIIWSFQVLKHTKNRTISYWCLFHFCSCPLSI